MGEPTVARWKLVSGYVAFGLFAFVVSLYLTFPYDIVRERLVAEAARQGWVLTVGSMGPGAFGITARNVELSRPADPGAATVPGALPIDSLALRPNAFPPGVAFRAKLLGGTVAGSVGGLSDVSVDAEVDEVDLSDPRLKLLSGMDLEGEVNGEVSLDIPQVALAGPRKAKEPDLGQASGRVKLDLSRAKLNGGSVTLTLPAFGNQPTPIDLPRIAFGDLSANLKFDKGQGTIETLRGKSEDLELQGTGTLKLAKNFLYSEPRLELKLKTEDEFRKRLGLLGSAFSMLPADPANPAFRVAKIEGYLGRPALRQR